MEAAEAAMGPGGGLKAPGVDPPPRTGAAAKEERSCTPTELDCPWHHSGFCTHGRTAQPNRQNLGCLLEWRHCQPARSA